MIQIRVQMVYNGQAGSETYVNMKQVDKGVVEYYETHYFARNSRGIDEEPRLITAAEANRIFLELIKTADPYVRYSDEGLYEKMETKYSRWEAEKIRKAKKACIRYCLR